MNQENVFICDEKSYNALVQTKGEGVISFKDEEVKISTGECVFIPAGSGGKSNWDLFWRLTA